MQIDFASEIRQRVEMRDLAKMYGIDVDRSGFASCPFHTGDRSPSLKLYPDGRGWHCFACGSSGSAIDFVMRIDGIGFKPAMSKINDMFNLGLPISSPITAQQRIYYEEKQTEELRRRRTDKMRLESAERRYNAALDLYCACDLIMCQSIPMSDEWSMAARNMASAEYRLDIAQMEVNLLIEQQRNHNTGMDGKRVQDNDRPV